MSNYQKFIKTRKSEAITTITQCRVPIFAPVKQLPKNALLEIEIENAWGKIRFKNSRLTQIHRNLLDCIFSYYEKRFTHEDGCVTYLISMRQLQKRLGITATHHQWIIDKLDELRETTMVIQSATKGWGIHTGIVRKHKYTKFKNKQLPANFTESLYVDKDDPERPTHDTLYGITFESEYMQIFKDDMNIHSENLTTQIINLKNPLLQALVRFCISHRQLNMIILDVLKSIGCNISSDRGRQRITKTLKDNAEKLEKIFDIKITYSSIFYSQHPQIWFENPQK